MSATPKIQIVQKLRALREAMIDVATDMDYYGGLNPLIKQHSQELLGAAEIAGEWADNIELEVEHD